jgi:hypothetical protein
LAWSIRFLSKPIKESAEWGILTIALGAVLLSVIRRTFTILSCDRTVRKFPNA